MQVDDLGRVLDAVLHNAGARVSLTLTDPPDGESELLELLDGALGAAYRNHVQFSEIQLGRARYPRLGASFHQVPITAVGDPGVLRLVYEP